MRPVTVWTLCLLAIAAVIGAAVGIASRQPATEIARGELLFPGFAQQLDRAATIEIVRHDGTVVFVKHSSGWIAPAKGNYPVKSKPVRETLLALANLETIDAKTRQPALYSRLDVEDVTAADAQSTLLTVKDGSGLVLASLLVGKAHAAADPSDANGDAGATVYVRKPGDAQSWLARGAFDLAAAPLDWVDRTVGDVPQAEIAKVVLHGADGKQTQIERDKAEDTVFKLLPMPIGMAVKSQYDVNALANTLEALSFDDVAPASSVSVPAGATAGAEFRSFKGLVVSATIVPKNEEKWVILHATGTGEEAAKAADAFNAKVKDWTYRLPAAKQAKLETTLDQLIEPIKKPQKPAS
jgi:hypothetical protein